MFFNSQKNISPANRELFEKLDSIFNANLNYCTYKTHLLSTLPPLVPYLGVYLRDLTFLEVGNATFIDEQKTIVNFDKFRMIASVLHEIETYQQIPYSFQPLQKIQTALRHSLATEDEETLYRLSVTAETVRTRREGLYASEGGVKKKQTFFRKLRKSAGELSDLLQISQSYKEEKEKIKKLEEKERLKSNELMVPNNDKC